MTKLLFVLVLLFFGFEMNAQTNKKVEDLYAEAQKQFSTKNYSGTIKICKQILSSEPGFKDAHLLLADVYSNLDSVNLEILHLNKAGEIGREWDVVFRLGEAHYKKGDYSEALRYYNIYSDYKYIPEKRQFLLACKIASCRFTMQPLYDSQVITPQKTGNTATEEFWPVTSADGKKLVFKRLINDRKQLQDQEAYKAEPDSAIWDIANLLNDTIAFYNEGMKTLSDSSKIMFFTACDHPGGLGSCDIYFIKFEGGKWSAPVNAGSPLNSEYWEGQPSFSTEGQLLYFSSDRSGGKGKKDIWKSELLGFSDDGLPKWKEPVNLGNAINTTGDEISPFIYENKHYFYFASDGLPSIGGMDLYSAEIDNLGNITNLKNLGYPINTHYDDDGLTLSYICDTTYFSSSRQTEKGMEIFAFNLDRGLATSPVAYVKVKVTDLKTKKPVVAAVKLESQPFNTSRFQSQDTDENGETMFCIQLNRNYAFTVSEPGYLFNSRFLNQSKVNSLSEPQVLDIELEPIEVGAEVQLYNIYYETDSFRILPQSESELQNLVTFLKNNSVLKIEIQGHTDSSGNAEANQILSQRRAKSVVEYLTRNGINTNRLKFGGYGDKVPIASNETVEGRMLNRRTTIKILEK
ncbi:MAG TPA: OmpA family protein [Draconibacterium sp.]|nr:OmpA family protein [Draconibacterium sp.]